MPESLAGATALVLPLVIGIAFGAILERAGLGDARVIRGQLTGHDFSVVLVMFGAIGTAMLGLLWADVLGFASRNTMAIPPTDLGAQALGAIIFGGGFGMAALCPGTACVAAASGRRDGMAAVAGVFGGTLALPAIWPGVASVVASVPDEGRTLPADLGLPTWAVATIITSMAILGAMLARRVKPSAPGVPWWHPRRLEVAGFTLALALVAADGRQAAPPAAIAALAGTIAREEDHVDAVDLARMIREERHGLRIVDLRDGVDTGTYIIPGAEVRSLEDVARLKVKPGEFIVLYSDGGAHAAQGWVLMQLRGVTNVRVLRDGMAAWEDEVLTPVAPQGGDSATAARWREVRELSLWFGGQPRVGVMTRSIRETVAPGRRRRRTC